MPIMAMPWSQSVPLCHCPDLIPGRSLSSPDLPQAGDGASPWLQQQTGLSHRCLSLEFQRDEVAQGQVCKRCCSSSGSRTEQGDGAQPRAPGAASPGDHAGEQQCLGDPRNEGSAHSGPAPDSHSCPTAPCASSLSRAGCTSSCHKINWQLNVLLLLVLSKEMKLFMVLQVTEFVHKGSVWEIIAANPNFLRHLSVEVPSQVVRPGGAAE